MPEFQLFRIKVYENNQLHLFEDLTRPQILLTLLEQGPAAELRRGITWHVGKIHRLDDTAIYFRLGKTTRSTVEVFREGDFVETEFESAPYTHIFLDRELGVTAIARKTRLAPRPQGIARQLERLLNETPWLKERGHRIEIGALKDPEEFIQYLRSAYSVRRFSVTFTPPNPLDIDDDITRPFQEWLSSTKAIKGKAEIDGPELDAEKLASVARSAAATGNEASARLSLEKEARPVTKHLSGGPVTIGQDELGAEEEKVTFLARIRAVFRRVAGKDGDET